MYYLYILTGIALLASLMANRKKTLTALKVAVKKFLKILPAFLSMLILISLILFAFPDEVISNYLGNNNKVTGMVFASFFGSITFMPGFITFPLCGILLEKGVSYMVLSAFTTTLMMVGIITYPIEKEYFGVKVTIIRNVGSFFIGIIVALITGIFFGEVF